MNLKFASKASSMSTPLAGDSGDALIHCSWAWAVRPSSSPDSHSKESMGQTQIMQQDKPGITGIRRRSTAAVALVFAGPITVCALAIQYQRGTSRARTGRPRHPPPQPRSPPSLSLSVLRVRRFLIPKQLILLNQQSVPPPSNFFQGQGCASCVVPLWLGHLIILAR